MSQNNTSALTELYRRTGCPHAQRVASEMTDCPRGEMSPQSAKAELYGLLTRNLHVIVDVMREFREQFPSGLVRYNDSGEIVGQVDDSFNKSAQASLEQKDFLALVNQVYAAFRRTSFIAGDVSGQRMEAEQAPEYTRMRELISRDAIERYGEVDAVKKRMAAAVAQTFNTGAGIQVLLRQIFLDEQGREPTREEMQKAFSKSKALGIQLTGLHESQSREFERIARTLRDAESYAAVPAELFTNRSLFCLEDGRLQIVDAAFLAQMSTDTDTSNGRFTCPGKQYISGLWDWHGEVSDQFVFGMFAQDAQL